MTTSLDILDTVVKIGLGMLITALSTYFLNRRTQLHELRKMRLQESSQWLRECLTKFERASTLINHANWQAFSQLRAVSTEAPDIRKSIEDITTAFNEVKEARSISYLLDHKAVGQLMSQYALEIDTLRQRYSSKQPWDADWIEANGDRRTALKTSILIKLAEAYKSIYV
jgi:hypothetical protein